MRWASRSRLGSISGGGFLRSPPRSERVDPGALAPLEAANPRCPELIFDPHDDARLQLSLTFRRPSKRSRARLEHMRGDADIARIGALVADPARARMLMALGDGRAL